MTFELGKYAFDVLLAYGLGLFVLAVLVGVSLYQARIAQKRLSEIEHHMQSPEADD